MHSVCYVIVPESAFSCNCEEYIKSTLANYDSELEVEPYKEFYSKEKTEQYAKKTGIGMDLKLLEEYLKEKDPEAGIENGLIYVMSTYNKSGKWDAYTITDTTKLGKDLLKQPPFSLVTTDGVWHSMFDVSYKPLLDWEGGCVHAKNIEAVRLWEEFYAKVCQENQEQHFVILDIHS